MLHTTQGAMGDFLGKTPKHAVLFIEKWVKILFTANNTTVFLAKIRCRAWIIVDNQNNKDRMHFARAVTKEMAKLMERCSIKGWV